MLSGRLSAPREGRHPHREGRESTRYEEHDDDEYPAWQDPEPQEHLGAEHM
jgi:hypothetical protein